MSAPESPRAPGSIGDERAFLLRSLRDLEREHAAGDVSDEDYARLRAEYTERAAAVLRAGPLAPVAESRPRHRLRRALGRRRVRRSLAISGTVLLLAGIALAAASFAGVRLPGESATGSVTIPQATKVAEQLEEASVLANEGLIASAINLYAVVLSEVPKQEEALTYSGWLERLSGLRERSAAVVRAGDEEMAGVARDDPGYPDAHALYGIALYEDEGDHAGALAQFRAFLADHPAKTLTASVGPQISAIYRALDEPVPAALPAR